MHDLQEKSAKYALGTYRGPFSLSPKGGNGNHDPATVDYVESIDTKSLKDDRRAKCFGFRRHWRRFWCCYLLGNIIFLAIFLPIFFLICIPAIAQLFVNKSSLNLVEAHVMQPRPNSIQLSMKASLKLPTSIPVQTNPFSLSLFNRALPGNSTWATVYLPNTDIKKTATIEVHQRTELNPEQWMYYVHQAIFLAHAPLSVKGSIHASIGKLKAAVTLDKDIEQNTMNGFSGLSISDATLILPPRSDGTNLVANITLPNPSVMTLEIGTVVFDLKSEDLVLGNGTIDNLVLEPGNHANPMTGTLDMQKLISNFGLLLEQQAQNLMNGYLNLTAVGKSVTYAGVEVPYYTQALQNLTLTAQLPLAEVLINTLQNSLDNDKSG
ncbi:hypothetical protein N7456_001143 [Penicillium angulare]|uniref:Uncharacterized protein n=1 Tax=Penicillium angulare TaxID=116970 RepID=A0A9W9KSS6_9EURO|nr:hypothetical protein N7456_001143 [Penicillium angulare]